MTRGTHDTLVVNQFGPRADAYVSSAVHASGPDLEALADWLSGAGVQDLLDLGCGGGHVSFHAAPLVTRVVAYDLSSQMLDAVRRTAAQRDLGNITPWQGAAETLPFTDGSFDRVVSRFSAHHWQDLRAGLAEARRVLRPGGRALFMDVVSPDQPLLDTFLQAIELLRDPSHVRNYTVQEWRQALADAGFVPQPPVTRRLPLEFTSWVERIGTPETHVAALRSLQSLASREVREHFRIQPEGSFELDTVTIEAVPA